MIFPEKMHFSTFFSPSHEGWRKTRILSSPNSMDSLNREKEALLNIPPGLGPVLKEASDDELLLTPIANKKGTSTPLKEALGLFKENEPLLLSLAQSLLEKVHKLNDSGYCHYGIEPDHIIIPGVLADVSNMRFISFSRAGRIGEPVPEWFVVGKYYPLPKASYNPNNDFCAVFRVILECWAGREFTPGEFEQIEIPIVPSKAENRFHPDISPLPPNLLIAIWEAHLNYQESDPAKPSPDHVLREPIALKIHTPKPAPTIQATPAPIVKSELMGEINIGFIGQNAVEKAGYMMALFEALEAEGKLYIFRKNNDLPKFNLAVTRGLEEQVSQFLRAARENSLERTVTKSHSLPTFFIETGRFRKGGIVCPDMEGALFQADIQEKKLTSDETKSWVQIISYLDRCDGLLISIPGFANPEEANKADKAVKTFFHNWKLFSTKEIEKIPMVVILPKVEDSWDKGSEGIENAKKYLKDNFGLLATKFEDHRWVAHRQFVNSRDSWEAFFVSSKFGEDKILLDAESVVQPFFWLLEQIDFYNKIIRPRQKWVTKSLYALTACLIIVSLFFFTRKNEWEDFQKRFSSAALSQKIELCRQELERGKLPKTKVRASLDSVSGETKEFFQKEADQLRSELQRLDDLSIKACELGDQLDSYRELENFLPFEEINKNAINAFLDGQERILKGLETNWDNLSVLNAHLDFIQKGAKARIPQESLKPVKERWVAISWKLIQENQSNLATATLLEKAIAHKKNAQTWNLPLPTGFEIFERKLSEDRLDAGRLKVFDRLEKEVNASNNEALQDLLNQMVKSVITDLKSSDLNLPEKITLCAASSSECFNPVRKDLEKALTIFQTFKKEMEQKNPDMLALRKRLQEIGPFVMEYSKKTVGDLNQLFNPPDEKNMVATTSPGKEKGIPGKKKELGEVPYAMQTTQKDDLKRLWVKNTFILSNFDHRRAELESPLFQRCNPSSKEAPSDATATGLRKVTREIFSSELNCKIVSSRDFKNIFWNSIGKKNPVVNWPSTRAPNEKIKFNQPTKVLKDELEAVQQFLNTEFTLDLAKKDVREWKKWADFIVANQNQPFFKDFPNLEIETFLRERFGDRLPIMSPGLISRLSKSAVLQKLNYAHGRLLPALINEAMSKKDTVPRFSAIKKITDIFNLLFENDRKLLQDAPEKIRDTLIAKEVQALKTATISGKIKLVIPRKADSMLWPGRGFSFKGQAFKFDFGKFFSYPGTAVPVEQVEFDLGGMNSDFRWIPKEGIFVMQKTFNFSRALLEEGHGKILWLPGITFYNNPNDLRKEKLGVPIEGSRITWDKNIFQNSSTIALDFTVDLN